MIDASEWSAMAVAGRAATPATASIRPTAAAVPRRLRSEENEKRVCETRAWCR
jgi:hypothetical protein